MIETARVRLTDIVIDGGTQVRASLDEAVMMTYAERMAEGDSFPPITVFTDGTCREDGSPIYFLADGFHRTLAARKVGYIEIDAQVEHGGKSDALWFALGANRTNGHQMTPADKKHAIVLALTAWPDRSQNQIAEQIGCSQRYVSTVRDEVRTTSNLPDRITGKDGKSYPASYRRQAKLEPPIESVPEEDMPSPVSEPCAG